MKKNSIATTSQLTKEPGRRKSKRTSDGKLTIGLDLGDRTSRYCIINEAGEVVSEAAVPTTAAGLQAKFGKMPCSRLALEVGTHSPWVSRILAGQGHEVIVANPHRVKLISQSMRKNDRMDAWKLARLARIDPNLLAPIQHRGEQAQADLAVIRSRAVLIECRSKLVSSARGTVKSMGARLKNCDNDQAGEQLAEGLSQELRAAIGPMLKVVEEMTEQLAAYNKQIAAMEKRYPVVELLKPVYGVGTLVALTFVLTIEDEKRFEHSRDVGCYVGLQPKQRDSGESQPELGISKAGDTLLRSYLVQAAHCQMRKNAPDSDLRAWGMEKAGNGKRGKKIAVVGVARRLAVLLHRLWSTGEVYDPLYNRKAVEAAKKRKGTVAA